MDYITTPTAFRWAYAAVCALAIKLLEEDNKTCGDNWPRGQQWDELSASSKAVYLQNARELAGIPHETFLAVVRSNHIDIQDVFERGSLPPSAPLPSPRVI